MKALPPNLAALNPLDLRAALAGLPQKRGPIGSSPIKDSVTIHYAGTAERGATTDAAAQAQIRSEAVYHINKVWGYADPKRKIGPIYGDGIMYALAVLPSGRPAVMRDLDAILYHCGNAGANARSIAITTLRGIGQAITDQQWHGVEQLLDALIADFHLGGRQAVKGHREWPRSDGTGQSVCPGDIVFDRLQRWRQGPQATHPVGLYEVITPAGVNVRTGPNVSYPKALGDTLVYPQGSKFTAGAVVPDERGMDRVWLWDKTGIGFVAGDPGLCRFVHP
jgi:hypothetical protein